MKKLFKFLVAVFMGFALVSCTTTDSLKGVSLNKEVITLVEGETATLEATIRPEELASETTIVWSTTNEKVATVDDEGVVTAIKAGTAKIKVIATRGAVRRQDTCTVKVLPKEVPVTGVTLDKQQGRLDVGESIVLTPTVLPEDATNKDVTWSSSNEEVAAVNGGVVTALSVGNATITVTTVNNSKTASFILTVYQSAKGVSLNEVAHTMEVGDTFVLTATVDPEYTTNKEVTWASSNPHVAAVNNGHVTAYGPGNAIITVTTVDGNYKATCFVSVVQPVTGVTLDASSLELVVNEETTLVATVLPSDATNKEVTWVSSNPSVAKVNDGTVEALAPGNAVVSVITLDGQKEAKCTITVTQPVNGVELNENMVEVELGDTFTLEAKVYPTNATNKEVKWTSSNEDVATIVNGEVHTHGFGNATIIVETLDGKYKDLCLVTVTRYVDDVTLNHSSYSMNINNSVQLEASILPEDAQNTAVTWTSSDDSVAFVNNKGLVVGLKVGNATITATTKDGNHKATCLITVEKLANEITSENIQVTYGEDYEVEFSAISNEENAEIKYYRGLREISKPVDAGVYKAIITVPESETHKKTTLEVSLVIEKRVLIIEIDDQEVTYGDDEATKTYELIAGELVNNHEEQDVFEITRSEGNDADTYEIYVEIINDNYIVLYESAEYVINPKEVEKPVAATGLVYNNELLVGVEDNEGYSVEDGEATNADTYIAYVSLDSKQNYVWEDGTTDDLEIEYVIALRQIEVVIDDQDVIYGDEEESLTYTVIGDLASNQEDEDVFAITRVAGDNVGTYDITLTQLDDNYNITSNTATYTIEKYEITGIDFDDQVVEYDGLAHKLEITGTLPEGVEVTYTPTNEYTEKGVYDIEASFTDTTGNYIVPEDMMATLEIYVSVKGISLNETSLRLDPNDTYTLVATLNPIDPTNDAVIWVSTDESVVEVDQDGNLVALEVGHALVVVTTIEGGFSAICSVEVSILPESVEITNTEEKLLTTDLLELEAVVYPLYATYQNVTWTSSDTNIATVDSNGVVTPVEPGFVTITVTTVVGNFEDEITIEIVQLAEEILLNRETASIVETYSLQLIATVKPNDTTNKSVIWSSSNETVATVDQNGLVEALSEGTTTITVKTLDGTNLSVSCEITVTKLPVHAETVTIERTDSGTVLVDENVYLKAVVEPVDITDTITWTSSDATIASVNQAGVVTALSSGTVTITAYVGKDTIYEKKATYEVEIFKHATNIFGLNSLEITYGTAYEFDPIASSGLTVDVKYYEGSTLLDEKPVNAGTYRVVASVESNYKYEAKEVEATLTINKVQLDKPLANANNTFTYNKGNHTYTLETSDYYAITGNVNKNAGNYEALVTIKDTVNYEWIDGTTSVLSFPYVINKAKVNTPTASTGLVYNKNELTGVEETEFYDVEGGKATNAGTYFAQVTLKDTSNYEWLDSSFDGSVMWSIEQAKYDMSGAYWSYTGPYTYDGQAHGVELKGLPTGVEVVYALGSASATNAGTYTARIDHFVYDDINYILINNNVTSFTWIINKQELDMQDVAWDYDDAFAYNGSKHTVTLENVPSEITVTYTDNEATNAGTYVAVATFAYNAENYVLINNTITSLTWNIERVNKTITVNDILVAKGESYSVTYVVDDKASLSEYSLPEGYVGSKVYDLAALKPAIEGTTGEVEVDSKIFNIDATNGKFVYADHNQWIQVNEGTIITFEVSQGSQISYVANNPTAFVSSVNGTTATIEAVGNDWLRTITVSNSLVVSEPTKIDLSATGAAIEGSVGTYGPLTVDATSGKFKDNNGGWVQVNAGTIITLHTLPNYLVELDAYTSEENFKVTNNEGLVTIEVLANDYIKTIYVRKVYEAKESEVEYFLGEQKVSKPTEKGIYTIKVNAEVEENYKGYDEASLEIFVKAQSVTLDYSSASVALNGTLKLNATVNPDDTNDQRVVWSSNNEAVATVDQEGNVTPVSEGEATITVTTVDGGHTATCVVRVTPRFLPATDVELSQAEDITTMKVGDTLALTATFTPIDHTDNVRWTSSNSNIASVHNGVVTALKATNEPIIITVEAGNVSATYTITSITKVETTITDLNDVTATYGDDYVVAPETNSDGNMTITYVGVDNEYNSTTKPTNVGTYNIEVVVEETTKYTAKAAVATLTINKKQVEKDIYLGDMIVEKGEAFDINYVEKENTSSYPTYELVESTTYDLTQTDVKYQENAGDWSIFHIDATTGKWEMNANGWVQVNAGTIITFEVPQGAQISYNAYTSSAFESSVVGTHATIKATSNDYLKSITVTPSQDVTSSTKIDLSATGVKIEGSVGTYGPLTVDATNGKFADNNGGWTQVNAGTIITFQTVPGAYVSASTYQNQNIFITNVDGNGLATITITSNGYINNIYVTIPNKVLGEEGTVKFYNALNEEVTPNVNGTYKMVLTIGEDSNHIGVTVEAKLTVITSVTGVELNKEETTLAVDGTEKLTATITPSDVTNSELVWSSSNNNVVVVDQNGNITALQPGEVTITVTTVDGGYTDTCVVTVSKYANTITAGNINTTYGEPYAVIFDATANKENAVITYYDGETELDEKPTNVGIYRVVITVPATETYEEVTKEVTLNIAPKAVAEPKVSGTYTYNTTEQEVELDGYDSSYMTIEEGSVLKATDADTYTIVITLDSNHTWAEESDGNITWTIGKATLDLTDAAWNYDENTNFVYVGNAHTVVIENITLPSDVSITYSGNTQTNASDNYLAVATLNYDPKNYNVNGTLPDSLTWKIAKADAEVTWGDAEDRPYTGQESQKPVAHITSVNNEHISLNVVNKFEGEFKDVGTYTFSVDGFLNSEENINNYNLSNTTKQIKITAIPLTVTITPNGGTYGSTIEDATYEVEGYIGEVAPTIKLTYSGTAYDGTVYEDSEVAPTQAGVYTVKATNLDSNYSLDETTVEFSVSKAKETLPEDVVFEATYGQTLLQVELPTSDYGTWSFVDASTSVGNAGNNSFTLRFTSTDDNYASFDSVVVVTVKAKEITVSIIPNGGEVGNVRAAEVTFNNVIEGDDVDETITYVGTDYNSSEVPNAAGTYSVKVSINNDNYVLTGIVEAEFVVTEPAIPVENVSFEETLLNLEVGGSDYTLIPRINPNNATNTNVSWSVSPAGIVTVVDGVVTPVAKGEAIITVTTVDGNKTATCSVKVSQPVTSVDITTTKTNYTTNDLVELEVEVGPENADNKTVTWTAEPTEVAEVNESGIVTPLKAGTVTITATAGNKSDSITLTFDQGLDHVVIYEVYGGGGNSGATYQNDYVVLYNPTLNDIDITGYKINKLSDEDAVSDTFTLVGKVESKKYYIVKLVAGSNEATKITEYNIYGTMLLSEKNISITLNDGENDIDTVKTGDILSSTKSYRRNADNLEFAVGEPNLSLYNDNLSTKVGIKSVTFNKDSAMKVDYKYSRSGKTLLELGLSTFDITFDNDYQLTIKAKFGDIAYLESVTSTFDSTQVTEEGQYQTVNFKYGSNDILGSVDVTVKADELTLTLQESLNLETGSTSKLIEKLTILDSAIYDKSIPFEWVITGNDGIITIDEETDIMTAVSSGTVKIHAVYNGTISSNECEVTVTPVVTAAFEFGDKDETQKGKESSTAISTYTETNNEYNLKLSDGVKMYNKSYDALGNSVLKLGSSSDVGSFNIVEIPSDIKTVVIYVSGRLDSTADISINGVVYSLTTTSNSGSYTPIMVDSSINKTISFTSLKTGDDERCMIDRIEYFEEKLVKDKPVESISLSPSTLTLEAGATSEKLVVTFTPTDATNKNIIWTSSDENVASVQDGVITAKEPSETKTVTITAESEDGGHTATCIVTVAAKSQGEPEPASQWTKVTDASNLAVGDQIVIVATGADYALSTTQNGNNRGQADVVKDDETITFGEGVQVLTLEVGNKDNTFAFNTGSGYLYAASSGSNYLRTETDLSDNSSWSITIADGVATIKAQGTNTRNWLRHNNTSSIFSCYGSGQNDVSIYKYLTNSGNEETPTCEHTNTTTTIVDATCTKAGSITITCDACSEVVSTEEIPMIAHVDVDTDEDHNCDVCGATNVTEHDYVKGVCNCGAVEETPTCEHTNTKTTNTATCTEAGTITVTCDDCGEIVSTEDVDAKGHEYIDGICNNCGVEKPKAWTLVTDVATLKEGDQIVIVAKDYNYALSTTQNSNNRGQAAVTKSGNTITFDNDVQIITLVAGNVNGTFGFNTDPGYLYAASSSKNYLRTETTLSNNSSWEITITSEGVATIVAQGSNTRNTMQYNQSSSLFACYSSASQNAVCIYKLG